LPRWNVVVLGEYILEGPSYLYESRYRNGIGHAREFSLGQTTPGNDPLLYLSMYAPDLIGQKYAPRTLLPVVRRAVWNRYSDLRRRVQEEIEWPDITVEFFRTSHDDFVSFEVLLRKLDAALTRVPGISDGFEPRRLYQASDPGDKSPYEGTIWRTPSDEWGTYRSIDRSMNTSRFELSFAAPAAPELNAAWMELWQVMQSVCVPARSARLRERYFGLTPEQYAEALKSAAGAATTNA